MSLPWGKLKKKALVGASLMVGALSSVAGANAHAAKYRYEDLSALSNDQLVSHVFSEFEHDKGATRPNFFKEVIKELGFSENLTGEKIDSYLDNRFDELTPLQRIKCYMASMAYHIGDPYNAQIDDADSLARLAYRGKSDMVIKASEAYRAQYPMSVAMSTGQNKAIRTIPVRDIKETGAQGAIYPSIPDVVFVRTNRGALDTLLTIDHEIGHTRGYPNYTNGDPAQNQEVLDLHEEIDAKDASTAQMYGLEIENSELIQNSTSSESRKESYINYNKYMMTQDEVETRLAKMKRAYFLATGVAVNNSQSALEMLGAFGVTLTDENMDIIENEFEMFTQGYKCNLESSKDTSASNEMEAINFYKKHNKDVGSLCRLIESGYDLSGNAKNEAQLQMLINAFQWTPGLAQNDSSKSLGKHPQPMHAPTLDFREFMPGSQSGPDAGSIA